ncbi:hypothetical protein LCGC14_1263060 [marine sediment metagenome]|uniref:Uncharacterized protein n=1 Tax=marine sediment metagenome TaxID=412755 RepID=A0A0F9L033_9ZZZZ
MLYYSLPPSGNDKKKRIQFQTLMTLSPEEAGASPLALKIAKRILRQPAFRTLRKSMKDLGNLRVFCSFLAREIIGDELHIFDPELFQRTCNKQTPAQRGKQDGSIASI